MYQKIKSIAFIALTAAAAYYLWFVLGASFTAETDVYKSLCRYGQPTLGQAQQAYVVHTNTKSRALSGSQTLTTYEVTYDYQVAGTPYTVTEIGYEEPDVAPVPLTYLPDDPAVARTGDPCSRAMASDSGLDKATKALGGLLALFAVIGCIRLIRQLL